MMREEFYHSQYGDPDQHYCVNNTTKVHNYDEGVEIVSAVDREETRASESFLWLSMLEVDTRDRDTVI